MTTWVLHVFKRALSWRHLLQLARTYWPVDRTIIEIRIPRRLLWEVSLTQNLFSKKTNSVIPELMSEMSSDIKLVHEVLADSKQVFCDAFLICNKICFVNKSIARITMMIIQQSGIAAYLLSRHEILSTMSSAAYELLSPVCLKDTSVGIWYDVMFYCQSSLQLGWVREWSSWRQIFGTVMCLPMLFLSSLSSLNVEKMYMRSIYGDLHPKPLWRTFMNLLQCNIPPRSNMTSIREAFTKMSFVCPILIIIYSTVMKTKGLSSVFQLPRLLIIYKISRK